MAISDLDLDLDLDPGVQPSPRERIVVAATQLLADGGREAVSTRAVSAAAGVQAPTLYRLFGDKKGLLHAVAAHGFAAYLAQKAHRELTDDPVSDLRAGWDLHVDLGLSNPALYCLLYDEQSAVSSSPAASAATEVLAGHVRRIAEAGRLRVPQRLAVDLVQAAGRGTTLTLIGAGDGDQDATLSVTAREAVIAAITTDGAADDRAGDAADDGASDAVLRTATLRSPAAGGLVTAAVTLRALLPQSDDLTCAERALLEQWLDRIADRGR